MPYSVPEAAEVGTCFPRKLSLGEHPTSQKGEAEDRVDYAYTLRVGPIADSNPALGTNYIPNQTSEIIGKMLEPRRVVPS